ncbi:MAG TPA: DUF502 domain-containing protein [Steroidobacteraceae bacterium]|nr:DUF502 domain-containing protein [Steroidobacteraceae bacterium]
MKRSLLIRAKILRGLRRYLMSGLLFWLPILATVLVVRFILDLVDRTLLLLPPRLQPESLLGLHVPGFGAVAAVLILFLTGVAVTNFIGRFFVGFWEEVLNHIPFVRAIYGGVKSFSETLLSNSGNSFKKVLLVQYPREGLWSVGFQTAADIPEITAKAGEGTVCVFIPTTPNPTSGFIVMVPHSQVIELEMTVDEAMKMIVTLGVVTPAQTRGSVAHPPALP